MNSLAARIVGSVLLVAACFAAFAPVRHAQFLNYDDNEYVSANPHVLRGLEPPSIRWAFTQVHSSNWHPLTWIAHMIDVELFGGGPESAGAHHLANVAVHAVASVLLAWLGFVLTGHWWRSLFVAALFALHPLHVESVAWVSERKDTLSAALAFATLIAYASWVRARGNGRYLLVLALLAAGLMAKPMLVTLPAVMLLLDVWPLRRDDVSWPRRFVEKVPFFALVVASVALTLVAQSEGKALRNSDYLGLGDRVVNAVVVAVVYLRKMVWPEPLAVFYPHWALSPAIAGPSVATIVLSACVLAGASAAAIGWARRRGEPMPLVLWLLYLGTLVPVIGLVQVGPQAMADRYTYLPSIGIFALVAGAAAHLGRGRRARIAVVAACLLVTSACGVRTWEQCHVWRDSETLFLHALATAGPSWIAHNNLGQVYGERGEEARAREHYEAAVRLRPDDPLALYNLANTRVDLGDVEAGVLLFERSLRLDPDNAATQNNLGNALARLGRFDEAIASFERALELAPDLEAAQVNLAFALLVNGRAAEAVPWLRTLCERRPADVRAHRGLTEALLLTDPGAALPSALVVVQLDGGGDPQTLELLARALGASGRQHEAEQVLERARDLYRANDQPTQADAADALLRSMRAADAAPR